MAKTRELSMGCLVWLCALLTLVWSQVQPNPVRAATPPTVYLGEENGDYIMVLDPVVVMPIRFRGDSIDISRFDFLLGYRTQAEMTFLGATRGPLLDSLGWEYFTYQTVHDTNSPGSMRDTVIRIIGVSHLGPDSLSHAPFVLSPGVIANLWFRRSGSVSDMGMCTHVDFSNDCGVNTLRSADGQTTFVAVDAADSCLNDRMQRRIVLEGSAMCIIGFWDEYCGDINQNGVCPEIGDAILFRDYFIYGLAVFPDRTRRPAQILSTDVNRDGVVLTLADFFMLLREINQEPYWWTYPQQAPSGHGSSLSWTIESGGLKIDWNSEAEAGGLVLTFEHRGGSYGTPILSGAAEGMQVVSHDDGQQLHVLIYSFESGRQIVPGTGTILTIPFSDQSDQISLARVEAAGYWGEKMDVAVAATGALPREFTLAQNVPNPFNGTTRIDFSLAAAGHVTLSVYDILGRKVATVVDADLSAGPYSIPWDARDQRGRELASGIYFYRLTTPTAHASRKMVLQK